MASIGLAIGLASAGHAEPADPADSARAFCAKWSGFAAPPGGERLGRTLLERSNLAHGLLWLGVGGTISLATDTSEHWSDTNGFDRGIRNDLAASSRSGRSDASTASDVLLAASVAAPLLIDAGAKSWLSERDCDRALEIASDWTESLGLVLAIGQATKLIAGRARPYTLGCDRDNDYVSHCGGSTRFESFFSGHASLSAAAAALTCKDAFRRGVWGDRVAVQAAVCGLGAGLAVGTGLMRSVADKHWMTDVFTGWAVGALIGWFDVPGPLDLLHFRYRAGSHVVAGMWAPYATTDGAGVTVNVRW